MGFGDRSAPTDGEGEPSEDDEYAALAEKYGVTFDDDDDLPEINSDDFDMNGNGVPPQRSFEPSAMPPAHEDDDDDDDIPDLILDDE